MKIDVLTAAGMNYASALERFMNNADLLDELLVEFSTTDALYRAEQEYDKGDYEAMFFPIHELKGVAGNLSLNSLYTALVALTNTLRTKQYDDLVQHWQAVKTTFCETVDAIKAAVE